MWGQQGEERCGGGAAGVPPVSGALPTAGGARGAAGARVWLLVSGGVSVCRLSCPQVAQDAGCEHRARGDEVPLTQAPHGSEEAGGTLGAPTAKPNPWGILVSHLGPSAMLPLPLPAFAGTSQGPRGGRVLWAKQTALLGSCFVAFLPWVSSVVT